MKGFKLRAEVRMKRILICLAVLLCAAVQAEAKKSDDRLESAKRLRRLGNLLLVYAIDHQGKYPDSLQELENWGVDKKDLEWLLDNRDSLREGFSQRGRDDECCVSGRTRGRLLSGPAEGTGPGRSQGVGYEAGGQVSASA
jgi:hypothetical protein